MRCCWVKACGWDLFPCNLFPSLIMISMLRLVYYLIDRSFRIYELFVIIEYFWKLRFGIVESLFM